MQFNLQADHGDPMERCRLCACHCSPANKVDIFSEEGRTRELEVKMRACLPLESQVMMVADRLPKSVCCQCVALLERFNTFRQDCVSASALLRRCMEQYNARAAQQGGALQQQLEGLQHQMRRATKGRSDSMPTLEPQPPSRRSTEEPPPVPALLPVRVLPPADEVIIDLEAPPPHLSQRRRTVVDLADDDSPRQRKGTSLLKESLLRSGGKNRSNSVEELAVVPARSPRKLPHSVKTASVNGGTEEASNGGSRRKNAKPRKIARTEEEEEEDTPREVDSRPFSCMLCEKNFATKSGLSRHLNACHGIDMADVDSCESSFQNVSYPRGKQSPPSKPPRAVPAPKNYERDIECIEVEEDELSDGFLCCELCLRTFADKQSLWLHFRYTHKDEAPYACGLCLKLCGNNAALSRHWRGHYREGNGGAEYLSLERRYSCEICGRQDNSRKKLVNHLRIHALAADVEPDSLVIVNAEFYVGDEGGGARSDREEEFSRTTSSSEAYHPCALCFKAFESEQALAKHVRNSHKGNDGGGGVRPECDVCFAAFPSPASLAEHRFSSHPSETAAQAETTPDVLYCKYCSKQFQTMRTLESHQRQCKNASSAGKNADVLSHHCEVCRKSFVSEDCLVKHKKGAHRRRPQDDADQSPYNSFYFCEVCASSHATKIERWRHVNASHSAEVSLRCGRPSCGKVFASETLNSEHRSHHDAQGSFPNTCEICGRLSDSRVEFWKHVQGVHAEMLPLVCGVCLKMFNETRGLMDHVAGAHALSRDNFHCRVCARQYSNQAKCTRHEAIHAGFDFGDVPAVAPRNRKRKRPPSSAAAVILVTPKVTAAKPSPVPVEPATVLSCDVCPRLGDFPSASALAQHRRDAHKLHPCDLCAKFYGRNSHLWKHVNRKHRGDLAITCGACQKVSATRAQLALHMKKNHGVDGGEETPPPPGNNHILSIPTFQVGPQRYKTYDCGVCYRSFVKRYMLRKHERYCRKKVKRSIKPLATTTTDKTRYACVPCGLEFDTKQRSIEHNRAAHKSSPCEVCFHVCATRAELFAHVRSSHPGLECPDCARFVRSSADLEAHREQHRALTHPAYCELCGEVSVSVPRLWTHLNAYHKDDIPYLCGVCFARLPDTESLIGHVRERHPAALEAKNACRICAKAYCSAYRVTDHVNKYHAGYVACRECLLVFGDRDRLKGHSLEAHGATEGSDKEGAATTETTPTPAKRTKRSYDCDKCSLTFSQPSYLNGHRRRQHESDSPLTIKTECPDEEEEEEEEERRDEPAPLKTTTTSKKQRTLDESIKRLVLKSSEAGENEPAERPNEGGESTNGMPSLTNERCDPREGDSRCEESEMPVLELHDVVVANEETVGEHEPVEPAEGPPTTIEGPDATDNPSKGEIPDTPGVESKETAVVNGLSNGGDSLPESEEGDVGTPETVESMQAEVGTPDTVERTESAELEGEVLVTPETVESMQGEVGTPESVERTEGAELEGEVLVTPETVESMQGEVGTPESVERTEGAELEGEVLVTPETVESMQGEVGTPESVERGEGVDEDEEGEGMDVDKDCLNSLEDALDILEAQNT